MERIAAATQILIHLSESGVLCFTATHDIEMTELLKDCYDNYHFEEVIRDGDISFPYELLPGRAGTRNAIRLLALMGYDKEITESCDAGGRLYTDRKMVGADSFGEYLTFAPYRWYTSFNRTSRKDIRKV